MKIEEKLTKAVVDGLKALYGQDVAAAQVQLQKTKKEFEGHLTLVVFPFLRMSRKGPEQTAQEIGEYLKANEPAVAAYNVLLYMKNQDEVLKKIHDLLKPGGIFISATDCLARNFSLASAEKFWKSKLGLMPYTSFETPIGLMRKIQKHGFLVLEIVNLHQNPPNIFIVAQKIQKK